MEVFKIDSSFHVPIREYEELLNYISEVYGLPISVKAKSEAALLEYLSEFYKRIIQNVTKQASNYRFESYPNARKNTLSEFQNRYMEVPKYLCINESTRRFSYAQDVRARIDVERPNFINSLGMYWSNLESNRRISSFVPHMKYVENEVDNQGNPLYVLKPHYSRKPGATHRINTSEPNVQALNKLHRRNFLVPREGFVFVQADISGQDPSIFFNAMCRDEDIIEGFYETGEYYLPVVSKITGKPYEEIDKRLRESYKIGILSVMNGKTEKNLAIDMGSLEHAKNLLEFVNSNEMYQQFLRSAQRELNKSRPVAKSFVGNLEREIKQTGWRGMNQMKNSPIQMTGIALFAVSIYEFYNKIEELYEDFRGATFEEVLRHVRPILHLHDEVLLEVRNEGNLPELSKQALKWALSVKYEDWAPMTTDPIISSRYTL